MVTPPGGSVFRVLLPRLDHDQERIDRLLAAARPNVVEKLLGALELRLLVVVNRRMLATIGSLTPRNNDAYVL